MVAPMCVCVCVCVYLCGVLETRLGMGPGAMHGRLGAAGESGAAVFT